MYAVLGAGSVTGMFTVRELLQRGGNVRAVCRDPEKYRADIEELVAYFPRGKRGTLEFAVGDVTKPETLPAGACMPQRARQLRNCRAPHVTQPLRCVASVASAPLYVLRCDIRFTWAVSRVQRCAALRRSSSPPPGPLGLARAAAMTWTSRRVCIAVRRREGLRY